jgi:hypothetical protein
MAQLVTEWVNVTGDTWIIARESGEVWFHTPSSTKEDIDPFATPMTGTGSPGSTIGLLDGALNLGFSEIEKRLARKVSRDLGSAQLLETAGGAPEISGRVDRGVIGTDQGDDIADDRRVWASDF